MNAKPLILITLCLAAICGCSEPASPPAEPQEATVESLGRTIGQVCELVGYENVRVRGHGLVVGLRGTGSSECPSVTREYMLKHLRQTQPQDYLGRKYIGVTAEQLLESHDTAVVELIGYVPAGAPAGTRFDVNVNVVRATQTTSLQGGYLIASDLQIVVAGQGGVALGGHPVAVAEGPIFINPFPLRTGRTGHAAVMTDPRTGVVLGGARSLADRKVRVSLYQPSYRLAQQIQRRINGRFGDEAQRVADATTRSSLNLTIPNNYINRYADFFRVLRVLYLNDSTGYLELRLRELNGIALEEDADYEALSWAWEAIGRTSLAPLRTTYDKHDGLLPFFAARTARNLGDRLAIDALADMALDKEHVARLRAAQALAPVARDVRARATLGKLVNLPHARLRLLAYDGLRRTGDTRITSHRLPGGFKVESIPSAADNILCVWARNDPRIVLLGGDFRCRVNSFYESPDGAFVFNIGPGDDMATLTREDPRTRDFILCQSSLDVKDVIAIMALPVQPPDSKRRGGLGMSFSEIVGVLYGMCDKENQIIPAQFILHRTAGDLLN